ncbi:MAG: TspO/MBR family protein [Rhizobiaceae bacterium]
MTGRYSSLLVFLVLVIGGGLLIGYATAPGEWYAGLEKPPFNPPGWVFGPAWTVLYVLIAIAGWRAWRINPLGTLAVFWFIQMALNFAWSPIFFAMHLPAVALVVIAAMLAVIVSFIAAAWSEDRTAALLFLPYAAWVAFATVLNASIVWLNP